MSVFYSILSLRAKRRGNLMRMKIASSQLSLNLLEEVGIVMFYSKIFKEKHTP